MDNEKFLEIEDVETHQNVGVYVLDKNCIYVRRVIDDEEFTAFCQMIFNWKIEHGYKLTKKELRDGYDVFYIS